jgi:hypothetical protein
MFERPTKSDLDRSLSRIIQSAHRNGQTERSWLTGEFVARGGGQSTRLIIVAADRLDKIHSDATEQVTRVIRDLVEPMQITPQEITAWARPHLENLSNTLLGEVPTAGFPAEHQRVREQYRVVFQERTDGALRDVEIAFVGGRRAVALQPTSQVTIGAIHGGTQQIAAGGVVNQTMTVDQAMGKLVATIGEIRASKEYATLDVNTRQQLDEIADDLIEEAKGPAPDASRIERWGERFMGALGRPVRGSSKRASRPL